jgi:three-Cys-motif partner protein
MKARDTMLEKRRKIWDISEKPSTKTKLLLLENIFKMWLTIWNKQQWIGEELYIIDLFASTGRYVDNNKSIYGSPLIFLKTIEEKRQNLRKTLKFKMFFIEKNKSFYNQLLDNIDMFVKEHSGIRDHVEYELFNNDCNIAISSILGRIKKNAKYPMFVLIDPWGIKIEKSTISKIIALPNRKDIMFNYILEGARRTVGIARKEYYDQKLNPKELGSLETLRRFLGNDIEIIDAGHLEIMEQFADSLFTAKHLKVVGYDMPYPDRKDIVYYLLYASRDPKISDIVKDIYGRMKQRTFGPSLFGADIHRASVFTPRPKISSINRKSLLYKTEVEYAHYTINHVEGCMHGCRFPCYAFMMSKKFGRVSSMSEWRKPKIVSNALLLLEHELIKYKSDIKFVHLSFMTDPFMYDKDTQKLVPEVFDLTMRIIDRLNKEKIKVTTLTKGYYPIDIIQNNFLKDNEYGITLVSLSESFKNNFEPFSAPYGIRIDSLKKLHEVGLKTWVSIEPFPTPNLDETAMNIENLLQKISFVNKIIFGKLNYNVQSSRYKDNDVFYGDAAAKVIGFCKKNNISYHVKSGTPHSCIQTRTIFTEKK